MSDVATIAALVALIVATAMQRVSGTGFGLVAGPLLLVLLGPRDGFARAHLQPHRDEARDLDRLGRNAPGRDQSLMG